MTVKETLWALFRYVHHSSTLWTDPFHGWFARTKAPEEDVFLWEPFHVEELFTAELLGVLEILPHHLRCSDRHIIPQTVTVSFAFINAMKQGGHYTYHLLNILEFWWSVVLTGIISFLQQTTVSPGIPEYSDGLQDARAEFDSQQGQDIFLYGTVFSLSRSPPNFPSNGYPRQFPRGQKRLERDVDNSTLFSAEINTIWNYTFTPRYTFMVWYLFN